VMTAALYLRGHHAATYLLQWVFGYANCNITTPGKRLAEPRMAATEEQTTERSRRRLLSNLQLI
jgi:hypothetical protein